jgi:catechol 2,3-dioxygenase-like lactoylglutathione lyase family enzyme
LAIWRASPGAFEQVFSLASSSQRETYLYWHVFVLLSQSRTIRKDKMMNGDVDILHHIGLIVTNMDVAIARYEQLGFQFTPLSFPKVPLRSGAEPEELGAANRCAIFQNNYLEVLAVVKKERWDSIPREQRGPYDLDGPLSRYEGLHVMHFGADNLDVVAARLDREDTSHAAIARFQRLVTMVDGPRMMQARTLHFPQGDNPEALLQIAQHLTPELVLQPLYMQHRNGAKAVTECIVCTAEPGEVAAKYVRYTGGHLSEQHDGTYVIHLGYSRVLVLTAEHLEKIVPGYVPPVLPSLVGFTVAVAHLDMTRSVLMENQVSFQEEGTRLIVRPEDACGSAILFEQEKCAGA